MKWKDPDDAPELTKEFFTGCTGRRVRYRIAGKEVPKEQWLRAVRAKLRRANQTSGEQK